MRFTKWRIGCLVAAIIGVVLATWITDAILKAREAAQESTCDCLYCQFGTALANYREIYRDWPQAAKDESGRPRHSWRVLLLPYLGGERLYEQFDFSEPWNSPANMAVANQMAANHCYHCPSDTSDSPLTTTYLLVEDAATIWSNEASEIDRPHLLIVECNDSQILWTEPRDLKLADLSKLRQPHSNRLRFLTSENHSGEIELSSDPRELRRRLRSASIYRAVKYAP